MTAAQLTHLSKAFALSETDAAMFVALLHFAKCGETWAELAGRTGISRHRALKWLDAFLGRVDFDQSVRWRQCERANLYDRYTSIVDITDTQLDLKASNDVNASAFPFTSGHKGVCYKYQVTTTLQGTPIHVSAALPGRRNDVYLFEVPLRPHYTNDYCLLDGGYPGMGNHCRIPIRKPRLRPFTDEQLSSNRVLSRRRSNIERCNGLVKRFALLKKTLLDPAQHFKFVKLVLLCQHVLDRERNLLSPRYDPSKLPLAPAAVCDCDWKKS